MSVTIFWCKWDEKHGDSHELLHRALERYLCRELPELRLEKGEFGKPWISDLPQVFFSISHSEMVWGCAVSHSEVGLDLQNQYMKNNEKLGRRFFHPEEIGWMEEHGFYEFSRIWTHKESYVKYTGVGLTRGLDYFSVVPWLQAETENPVRPVHRGSTETSGSHTGDEETIYQQEIPFLPDYWMVLSSSRPEDAVLEELL